MNKIKLSKVSRKYIVDGKEELYAIKGISLIFSNVGFVSIVGRSGSGKSTILNIISGMDEPTEGDILYDGKSLKKFNKSERLNYYKNEIAILFQSYNLLDDQDALFNVMLPLLIKGVPVDKAKKIAENTLNYVGINTLLFKSKSSLLSGGEKQRVALARTIVGEPDVLLCDEPTGALDSKNSINVMNILKEYSKKHLVIMVSHNLQLTEEYSDRIIEVSEGKVVKDRHIKEIETTLIKKKKKAKNSQSWINQISYSNFKKRFKRNLFSLGSLVTSLVLTFVAVGFINGKDKSINEASVKQLDFGCGTIAKEEVLSKGTILSLTRMVRPNINDIQKNKKLMQNFDISLNFDAIFPPKMKINYDGVDINGVYFYPIYSYDSDHLNSSLISRGNNPRGDSLKEIIINQSAYDVIKEKLGKEVLGEFIDVSFSSIYTYVDFDNTYISDEFYFTSHMRISAVVDELSYLQTPKIYYSQVALESYLMTYILPNLSTYFNRDITWYDRISECENYNNLSSFSYRLFLKDYRNSSLFFDDGFDFDGFTFSSNSLTVRESLLSFMQVGEYGILLFLILTLAGAVLIMGIISFTSYSEDHKSSAILTCLGSSNSQIMEIYLNESIILGFVAVVLSLGVSFGLSFLINFLISNFVGLNNLVVLPISSFLGIPFLFPIASILLGIILCLIVTTIPIAFSKKISLKEELQSL